MTIAYEPQFGTVVSPRQFSPRRSGAATRGNVSVVLTARGRFVLAIVIAALVLAAVVLLGATVAASKDSAALAVETVRVVPGDTLWAIASEANPSGDIRETVSQIVRLNSLEKGKPLPAGVVLSVPIYE
jgi:LysM repeat protein